MQASARPALTVNLKPTGIANTSRETVCAVFHAHGYFAG